MNLRICDECGVELPNSYPAGAHPTADAWVCQPCAGHGTDEDRDDLRRQAEEQKAVVANNLARIAAEKFLSAAAKLPSELKSERRDDIRRNFNILYPPTPTQVAVPETEPDYEYEDSVLSVDEILAMPPVEWLLRGYIPKGKLVQLAAPSGAGKTLVALDWGIRLAMEGNRVLYVAAEGHGGIGGRVRAWTAEHLTGSTLQESIPDTGSFGLLSPGITPDLLDPKSVTRMLDKVTIDWRDKVDLVIFDTLAQVMTGNENEAETIGQIVAQCNRITEAVGCSVLLVHHFGWQSNRQRGSSALYGACDAVIYMEIVDEAEKISRVHVQKMKDGAPGDDVWVQAIAPAHPDEVTLRRVDRPSDETNLDTFKLQVREVLGKAEGNTLPTTRLLEKCGLPTSGRRYTDLKGTLEAFADDESQWLSMHTKGRSIVWTLNHVAI